MPEDEIDDYVKILEECKKEENDYIESIMPMMDDPGLINGVVAWQSVSCTRIDKKGLAKCEHESDKDRWNWLWSQVDYDYKNFAIVAGVKEHEIHSLLTRLIGLRLVYPDGTISKIAKGFMRNHLQQKFPTKKN